MARPARPEPKVFMSAELAGRGRAWYEPTYFAHADAPSQLLGEKSTSYLEDPGAARARRAVLGEAEIVVQLRDPVATGGLQLAVQHRARARGTAARRRR